MALVLVSDHWNSWPPKAQQSEKQRSDVGGPGGQHRDSKTILGHLQGVLRITGA